MSLSLVLLLVAASHGRLPQDSSRVVAITARDYALEMPDSIPAGATTFRLRNRGTEYHIASFARLDSGKSATEFFAAYANGGGPSWSHAVGGPGPAMPGRDVVTTLVLEPGRYVVFCDISSPDKQQHWKKGMFKLVTVVPSSSSIKPPASDVTVTLVDYTFHLSKPMTAGAHTIRVTNGSASRVHMLAIMRFRPGKTLDDERKWDHHGPEPIEWSTGTTDLDPGSTAYVASARSFGDSGEMCHGRKSKHAESISEAANGWPRHLASMDVFRDAQERTVGYRVLVATRGMPTAITSCSASSLVKPRAMSAS